MDEYDLNGNPKKPCSHPYSYEVGSWAEPTGSNRTILKNDPHGPTVRCTECGQIFRPSWEKWFATPSQERLIKSSAGYLTNLLKVWDKSAHLPLSDAEAIAAGREIIRLLSLTLLSKYPQFKDLNHKEQSNLKGYVIHDGGKMTDRKVEDFINDGLRSYGVKFDPDIHCAVAIPLQVVGSGTWVVFEIPKHPANG